MRVSALAGSREGNAATLTVRLSKSTSEFGVLVLHVPTLACICPLSPCKPLRWQHGCGVPLDSPR